MNTQLSKPGYTRKTYLRLTQKVHEHLKKKGLKPKWNETQKFVSLYLFQQYKGQLISKIDYKDVFSIVDNELPSAQKIDLNLNIEEEICGSVFSVPMSDYILIEWYDIGTAIRIIPGDVKIRVNAGPFGVTVIDIRSNLDYHNAGIADIVAGIRSEVNKNSDAYFFEGETKLVPGRKDNGSNCNYFIDYVLEINGVKVPSSGVSVDNITTFSEFTQEEFKERKITKKEIESERRKQIAENKKKRQENKEKEGKLIAAKQRTRAKEMPPEAPEVEIKQDYAKIMELLYRDYKEGLITIKEYQKARAKIINKL